MMPNNLSKLQVNLIRMFLVKNKPEYLIKLFKYLYFYEILHLQNFNKSFSGFTFKVDERFPYPEELWRHIVSGNFNEKYGSIFKLSGLSRKKDFNLSHAKLIKITLVNDVLDEDLRWLIAQKELMENLKFKYHNVVPTSMSEKSATNTNFWLSLVRNGKNLHTIELNKILIKEIEPEKLEEINKHKTGPKLKIVKEKSLISVT